MGWKAGAEIKRQAVPTVVFPGGKKNPHMKQYAHVVVDVNAWFRSYSLDADDKMTPSFAVHTFFWSSVFKDLCARSVTFCFDDYSRSSEMRKKFYIREREKEADRPPKPSEYLDPHSNRIFPFVDRPLESSRVGEITAHTMPCRWSRAWNNKDAKIRLWEIIASLIKDIVRAGKKTNLDTEYIVHDVHGSIWTHPSGVAGLDSEMPITIEYGEGDLKAIVWSLHHARHGERTLLVTIDWDIPLSLLAHASTVDVLIARIFVHPEDAKLAEFSFKYADVALTQASARRKFGSKKLAAFEIVMIPEIVKKIGPYDRRLMYLMACLGFKGCDYCLGLQRFGYTEGVYSKFFRDCLRTPKFIETFFSRSDPLRRMIRFHPGRYLEFLRHGTPRKAKTPRDAEALKDFTIEVLDMLYVVRYSALFDCGRHPGGPPPPVYQPIFANAGTLETAIFDSTIEYDAVEFVETHPIATPFNDPVQSYPPKQAEAISAHVSLHS